MPRFFIVVMLALLALGGCGQRSVRLYVEEPFPRKLSAWRLFTGKLATLVPNEGVIPYDLNTPLFSDYAHKQRFVWMPAGTSATYHPAGTFEFPAGTILSKTFWYPASGGGRRLLETRLLVHTARGWVGLPYVWDDAQTEAVLQIAGDRATVDFTHSSGRHYRIGYLVPNVNECAACHTSSKRVVPIGPKAANLNRDFDYAGGRSNQLAYWTRIGYLRGAPEPEQAPRWPDAENPASGPLDARARAYLDVNCAHCHNPGGPGNTSGLHLGAEVSDLFRLGLCKVPVAAGPGSGDLRFGIVAGQPDASIVMRRMESSTPKIMMPELGRTVVHEEGVALLREWIASLRGSCGGTGAPSPLAQRQSDRKDAKEQRSQRQRMSDE